MSNVAPDWSSDLHMDPLPLTGRVVVVTGVSRRVGIGHATACRAAAWGAHLVCHHYAPHDNAQPWGGDDVEGVMASVRSHLVPGARLLALGGDLTAPGAPEALVAGAVQEFGRVDGLVANQALSGSDGALGELDASMLDRHWAVNARTSILLVQALLAARGHMEAGDGAHPSPSGPRPRAVSERGRTSASAVLLTSGQVLGPLRGEVAYGAAKAALAGITVTMADQLADAEIRLNTVNPGPVDTGYADDVTREAVASMFPGGRWGEPDDPARLICWLLTDDARWVTGQVINTEGGFRRG